MEDEAQDVALRETATRLIRGTGELFPKEHVQKALSKVEEVEQPPLSLKGAIAASSSDSSESECSSRKRRLRAECRTLQQQLQEKKSSEEGFLASMMAFFRDEDGKSINNRALAECFVLLVRLLFANQALCSGVCAGS